MCRSKRSKLTARCSSNSTLARSSPSKRPRKPCKHDHTPRALRIVSPQCAQRSEPSKADPLQASNLTLSSLPTGGEKSSIPISGCMSRFLPGRTPHSSASYLTHNNQPLIAHPSSKHTHITTTRRAFLNIHPLFPTAFAVHSTNNTLAFSIECREYHFGRIPCWDERAGCCRNNDHLFSLRTRRSYYYTIERRFSSSSSILPIRPRSPGFLLLCLLSTANTEISV